MTVRGMETGVKAKMSTHGWISFQPVKSHRKDLKVTMKIKQLFKKAAAMVMAAVTILSLLPTTAFAATGDAGTITFTRTYDSNGNVMYYNSGAVINGYSAGGTGKNKYRMFVDGSTAFCIQPGAPLHTGDTLKESSSATWNALSASQKKAVGLALLYGYQGNRDSLTGSDDEKWMATQTLVWEFVTGCRNSTGSYAQTDTTVYSLHFGSNYPNSGAAAAYDQIVSMLTRHNTVPSFMNGSSRELEYKDGKYTLTLTDTNGVLSEYDFSSSDRNVSLSKSGNTLTISSADAFSGTVRITATRNNIPVVSESAKLIAYGDDSLQDVVTGVENTDGVSAYLNVETPTGKFEIRETTAPFGMVLNTEVRTVELVYAGQEIEVTETSASFYSDRQKVLVSLDKVMEQNEKFGIGMNGEITAVTFGLYAKEDLIAADSSIIPAGGLLEILSVDENGHSVCKTDIPFGSYCLKEISTDSHYILSDTEYPVVFEYAGQDTALVEIRANDGAAIENDLIYGEVQGMKKDDSGNALSGALIGLFAADTEEFTTDTAILTATSAEDGSFSFVQVPLGNWIVREIKAPTGYVLSEEAYPVNIEADCAMIEVEIENTLIRGTVQLTKVDKDYPDNKLTGAEFELYRDLNGNKELDAEDEKLGTLMEVSTGIYEMSELTYGGYLVKETKAPEGFYLDENAYYFEITEHGKTVVVENEAGKGFINAAQVGSLKIIKTSSDGKVEGFSFRVTGANGYEQVFTTDKNGEILLEGLRIGDYTISEVSDSVSQNYVLPADKKATVFEGAVTKVEMHNELRDTPKTGDDSNPALWIALMGIAAVGAVTCGVFGIKNKKKKEDAE